MKQFSYTAKNGKTYKLYKKTVQLMSIPSYTFQEIFFMSDRIEKGTNWEIVETIPQGKIINENSVGFPVLQSK